MPGKTQMFRRQSYTHPPVTLGFPNANVQLVDGPDTEVLYQRTELAKHKVQLYGSSTKLFTEAYKASDKEKYAVKFTREQPEQLKSALADAQAWQNLKDAETRARRIMRGGLAIQGRQGALDKMFRLPPAVDVPTGQAAVTSFTDFARISSMLQTNDFAELVRPETIQAIVRGVFYRVSTPLFSAFVAYLNAPTTSMLPPQLSSRALFVDLVKRALLANNPAYKWEDFVSPSPEATPETSVPVEGKPSGRG
jgi:hypothetical protein